MSTQTRGDLTIVRHEHTDGTVSVYRGDTHLGLIFPLLGFAALPTDPARPGTPHDDEAAAIAYLSNETGVRVVVEPVDQAGDHLEHRVALSAAEIQKCLGFPPNVRDDPAKVTHSWGFTVNGMRCGVWLYRDARFFSAFGPLEALQLVFGAAAA